MDLAAPPSPIAVVAVCVVVSYALLAVIWRRSHWIVAYPRTVLAGLGAISLAAAFALVDFSTFDVRVHLDASEEPLMVRGDPAREVYRLATQAFGTVLMFEKMFENRLFFTDKLVSMGARIILCDPHRAVVTGPARLVGQRMECPDIRAGMAMLLAALAAEGQSTIGAAHQIDKGYERIDERLRTLGASIERIER